MRLIKAVIRPDRLNEVLKALYRIEVKGMTVSRTRGHGGEVETVETYRGTSVKMELTDKIMLDIGVSQSYVEPAIEAIVGAARTGEVGDGKIFVNDLAQTVRIRTGEVNGEAI